MLLRKYYVTMSLSKYCVTMENIFLYVSMKVFQVAIWKNNQ